MLKEKNMCLNVELEMNLVKYFNNRQLNIYQETNRYIK